jgi:hypothetical protein
MVQATNFRNWEDGAELRRLDWPSVRCIFVKREMGSCAVIVGEVRRQDAPQMPFAENNEMVQALASHRADKPLGKRVLPGAVRRREDFFDPHTLHAVAKLLAIDLVAVAEEIGRCGVVREGVHDLTWMTICARHIVWFTSMPSG